MKIPIQNNYPKIQKYIPIPLNAKEKVKEILDQLQKYGIIRVCNEPSNYCSNILVIKKKDGNSVRLLFDGRLLNYDSQRLPMATVSKPEILSHLVNKTHLTSLDFADAFFHIELDPESQPLTAFYSSVHSQRFCFTRAPQGLRNSPLYLKLLLDKVFADMADSCILFFDDLLVATNGTLDEHMKVVNEVLKRIIDAGLKLRPNKLHLAKESIEFLGMVFTKGKISIPEAKLEAFRKLPSPNTPKRAKSLICALSFYRHFVPEFASLSREIMELGNLHPKVFKWTADHEKKLRKLIDEICKHSQLVLPDPSKRFYVQTDSSAYCGGGRIFQKDDDGNELLIAAVSRTYSKTERHYSIFKKEILALLYTLKCFDYFLRFTDQLTILVDAKSIIYLRLAKDSSGILLRFSLEMSKYNAEIVHVSGENNIISDVLSRQNDEIDNILEENMMRKPLTEKESLKILKLLTIRSDYSLTSTEFRNILEGQSPTTIIKKACTRSKALQGNRKIKNTPVTLSNKKVNLPPLSMKRPGIILEKKKRIYPLNVLRSAKQKAMENIRNVINENYRRRPRKNATRPDLQVQDAEQQQPPEQEAEQQQPPEQEAEEQQPIQQHVQQQQPEQVQQPNPRQETEQIQEPQQQVEQQPEQQPIIDPIIETQNTTNINTKIDTKISKRKRTRRKKASNTTENPDTVQRDNNQQNAVLPNVENLQEQIRENPPAIDRDEHENDANDADHLHDSDNLVEYTDVHNLTKIIHDGLISVKEFISAQKTDEYCSKFFEEKNKHLLQKNHYEIHGNILFRKHEDKLKPILPKILLNTIITLKHYTIYGAHASPARITREIKEHFHINGNLLLKKLKQVTKTCYLCQIFKDEIKGHVVKTLPRPTRPRESWSMDIIPNMPKTPSNNCQILLCVDDFTSFVVCIPIPDSTSKSIISALKKYIFNQFGIPRNIRCDEQSAFYNSAEFFTFMKNYLIELSPTSVAAPFSNSRSESAIKNIKKLARKFLFQEQCIDEWDEYLPVLTSSHNSSIGIYGYSSEQLMFGSKIPRPTDLINVDYKVDNEEEYINHIFEKADKERKEATKRMLQKSNDNKTYKNANRILKKFEIGALVLHRQLQVSTGKGSGYKPKFTGPYVILSLNEDDSTAFAENIRDGSIIRAHFTNLQLLHFNPNNLTFQQSLPEKLIHDINERLKSEEVQAAKKTTAQRMTSLDTD